MIKEKIQMVSAQRPLEDESSHLDRITVNTSKRSQNSSHSQEYDDDDVGNDSNAREDNVNNHFGKYPLRNAAPKNSKEEHQ
ncbi:hypothetical protein INT45_008280 [Circinella minor]|uniref:Uncharacterized protein n=1 Tax=Circinella minor TaxID=1195481 RepID=A0A8H7RI17_9FUNG|nr:hypothetical protein INT45_008280 [Circinella minor]